MPGSIDFSTAAITTCLILKNFVPWPVVDIHPEDAVSLDTMDGDLVEVRTSKDSLKTMSLL